PIAAASSARARLHAKGAGRAHARISGATTSAPLRSPSHQVSHVPLIADSGTNPASPRLVTPTVALTMVPSPPARNAKRNRWVGLSSTRSPEAKVRTSHAPITPSSVLPAATASDVQIVPAVVRLARNA